MRFIDNPSASFGLVNKSHLKFDLDSSDEVTLTQPSADMFSDLRSPVNTMLSGPDFEAPISRYTLSQTGYKDGPCGKGLLSGSYRKMLGAD